MCDLTGWCQQNTHACVHQVTLEHATQVTNTHACVHLDIPEHAKHNPYMCRDIL